MRRPFKALPEVRLNSVAGVEGWGLVAGNVFEQESACVGSPAFSWAAV